MLDVLLASAVDRRRTRSSTVCQNRLLKGYLRVYTMLAIWDRGRNVLCVGMLE